jgi:hypothetical protein
MGITRRRRLLLCVPRIDFHQLIRLQPTDENRSTWCHSGREVNPRPYKPGIKILVILMVMDRFEWAIGAASPTSHLL